MSESFPLCPPYPLASTLVTDTSNLFESLFGYHRAVRKGPFIFVSGTTALLPDNTVAFPDDSFAQAKAAFEVAVAAVEKLGGCKRDVCRVRMFVAVSAPFLHPVAIGSFSLDSFSLCCFTKSK